MSRQIDFSKPLSDDDKEYLRARGREVDIVLSEGGDASSISSGAIPGARVPNGNTGDVDTMHLTRVLTDVVPPEDNLPAPSDYDDLKVAQLKDELARRDLPTSGKRQELIDRLVEDDDETTGDST